MKVISILKKMLIVLIVVIIAAPLILYLLILDARVDVLDYPTLQMDTVWIYTGDDVSIYFIIKESDSGTAILEKDESIQYVDFLFSANGLFRICERDPDNQIICEGFCRFKEDEFSIRKLAINTLFEKSRGQTFTRYAFDDLPQGLPKEVTDYIEGK